MSEMIQRIGRAAQKAQDEWVQEFGDAKDGLQEYPEDFEHERMASAAIKEMRNPTSAVLHDAFGTLLDDPKQWTSEKIWDAMIDAVLEEGDVP